MLKGPLAYKVPEAGLGQPTRVQSLGQEDSLEEGMTPTPVFLSGESHGQRSLVGYSPLGHKESDTTEQQIGRASCRERV